MLFNSPRGTRDILPAQTRLWRALEEAAAAVFRTYAFREIRTPVFEDAKLFTRSLGEVTDIVQKQMFQIKRETDTFVLRPEATASIVRAYVEHTMYNAAAVTKFYYMGPMFRAERPQKGRLRQFHHIGCEAIGSGHPFLDAEVIELARTLLAKLGVRDASIRLNTLGCVQDKKALGLALRESLVPLKKSFCEDCQIRMTKNIFRVLDCKNRQCRQLIESKRIGHDHVCEPCRDHFRRVRQALDAAGVAYAVDPLLVRGLDYYTRTVFEITHPLLGAQDAVGAGGRYDNLVRELGGPDRGAAGFALGFERLLLALGVSEEAGEEAGRQGVYLISLGEAASLEAFKLLNGLRAHGVEADMDYLEGSLKSSLRRADSRRAKTCLVLGDNELAKGVALVKDMEKGTQEEVPLGEIVDRLVKK
ncbi:MAG: histidine--tRNA ligase [Deltaproteobacteria bacterium]